MSEFAELADAMRRFVDAVASADHALRDAEANFRRATQPRPWEYRPMEQRRRR